MNRGLTLLELIVALSLLASLAVAAVGWTQTALRTEAASAARLRWESAARATLDLIADKIAAGDSPVSHEESDARSRVAVQPDALAIRGRMLADMQGTTWHVLVCDSSTATLTLTTYVSSNLDFRSSSPASSEARTLLTGVRRVAWTLDPRSRILTVRIESNEGDVIMRSYDAP